MKVISFKLYKHQARTIEDLSEKYGLYANTSEFIRLASIQKLHNIINRDVKYENYSGKGVKRPKKKYYPDKEVTTDKKAISCKFPMRILNEIDLIVKDADYFSSRTSFFREAVDDLISEDSETILSYLGIYSSKTDASEKEVKKEDSKEEEIQKTMPVMYR